MVNNQEVYGGWGKRGQEGGFANLQYKKTKEGGANKKGVMTGIKRYRRWEVWI